MSSSPLPSPSGSGRRLVVGVVVVLAALALALALRGDRPTEALTPASGEPRPAEPAVADSPAGAARAFEWEGGPELERRYDLAGAQRLHLAVTSGDVVVRPGPGSTAAIRVELAGGTRPPARFEWVSESVGDELRVTIESSSGASWLRRLLGFGEPEEEVLVEGRPVKVRGERARVARVVVDLPPEASLSVRTGAGGIAIADRQADVAAKTGAGDVRIQRVSASVAVDTGAGDVSIADVAGDVEVQAGAGDVTAEGVLGALSIDSGAGGVRFGGGPASVAVDTGAGGVSGELTEVRGPVEIDTGMGGIELVLGPGSACSIEARSGLGSVSARVDATRFAAERGEPLRLDVGGGGPAVRLRTGTGAVRIEAGATVN